VAGEARVKPPRGSTLARHEKAAMLAALEHAIAFGAQARARYGREFSSKGRAERLELRAKAWQEGRDAYDPEANWLEKIQRNPYFFDLAEEWSRGWDSSKPL